MKNSTIIGLTALAVLSVFTLFVINLTPTLTQQESYQTLAPSSIKSIDVVRKGVLYPLNFQQFSIAVDAISNAVEVKKSDYPSVKGPFSFEKLVITRYKGGNVDLVPIEYDEYNLVFSLNAINNNVYFLETSGGAFKRMLDKEPSSIDKETSKK